MRLLIFVETGVVFAKLGQLTGEGPEVEELGEEHVGVMDLATAMRNLGAADSSRNFRISLKRANP